MGNKRQDYISWDEYFMGVAFLAAMRSKDPGTQVGACIVSTDNKILSIGYNGMPIGCNDDDFPWNRESEDPYNNKYFYTTHSELNAILNYRGGSLEGAKIYVTLFPCNECAKAIIVELRRLFTQMINMQILRQLRHQSECLRLREWNLFLMKNQEKK